MAMFTVHSDCEMIVASRLLSLPTARPLPLLTILYCNAGVMAAVSLGELLPEARSYNQSPAVAAGMGLGVLSIFLTYQLV
jgi:hypothetical protein